MILKQENNIRVFDYPRGETLSSDKLHYWKSLMPETLTPPTVSDLMITNVVTVTGDMTLDEIVAKLIGQGIPAAPVVEQNNGVEELIGFITEKDCLEYLSNDMFYGNPEVTAKSMMQRFPLCVKPVTDIFTIADIFTNHPYRFLPVVRKKRLVGMISRRDVLRGLVDFQKQILKEKAETKTLRDFREIVNLRFIMK